MLQGLGYKTYTELDHREPSDWYLSIACGSRATYTTTGEHDVCGCVEAMNALTGHHSFSINIYTLLKTFSNRRVHSFNEQGAWSHLLNGGKE